MGRKVDFVADVGKGAGVLATHIHAGIADGFQNVASSVQCSEFAFGKNGAYFLDNFHSVSSLSFDYIHSIAYSVGGVKGFRKNSWGQVAQITERFFVQSAILT
jgi:hypothetical protein